MFRLRGTLVFVLATVSIFIRKADANNIGIAFSGGGFKSVADQTAVTAALLAELMRRDKDLLGKESPLASSELYKNVKSLSTISGGSWFTSYLVYSIKFRQMVEKMAKEAAYEEKKGAVSGIFYGEYGERFDRLRSSDKEVNDIQGHFLTLDWGLAVLDGNFATLDGFFSAMDNYFSQFVRFQIPFFRMCAEYFKNGLRTVLTFSQMGSEGGPQSSWFDVTKSILGDDINQMTLGGEVQEWSKGKSWNIITSATTVSGSSLIPFIPVASNIWVDAFNTNKLSYSTGGEKPENFPSVVPVLFSVVLGDEGSPPAPLPESVYSVMEKLQLTYKWWQVGGLFNWGKPKLSVTIEPGIQPTRNAHNSFADMPIVGPVAASSAAVGFTSIVPDQITSILTQVLKFNPAVGFACKDDETSTLFSTGQEIIDKLWNKNTLTRKDFDTVTDNGVCNFLDGGASDPFGISTALASGANEIFCVNAIPDLATVQNTHFGGFPLPFPLPSVPLPATLHIFDRETATYEEQTFETADGAVKNMKFQKITVKTVGNIYFGIEGGREVTLYVFSAESTKLKSFDIVAGSVKTFKDIGEYIEDIMATFALPSNNVVVNKMLMALGAFKEG